MSFGEKPSLTHFGYDVDLVTSSQNPAQSSLATAVLELEQHAAGYGWDGPVLVFALVNSRAATLRDPRFADTLPDRERAAADPHHLTAVEQQDLPHADSLEDLLASLAWPDTVDGAAVVVESLLGADAGQDVRLAVGVLRGGESWCAVRLRSHDDDALVLSSADAVPGLVEAVRATLTPPPGSQPPPGS